MSDLFQVDKEVFVEALAVAKRALKGFEGKVLDEEESYCLEFINGLHPEPYSYIDEYVSYLQDFCEETSQELQDLIESLPDKCSIDYMSDKFKYYRTSVFLHNTHTLKKLESKLRGFIGSAPIDIDSVDAVLLTKQNSDMITTLKRNPNLGVDPDTLISYRDFNKKLDVVVESKLAENLKVFEEMVIRKISPLLESENKETPTILEKPDEQEHSPVKWWQVLTAVGIMTVMAILFGEHCYDYTPEI